MHDRLCPTIILPVCHKFAEVLGWHLQNLTGPWASHQYMSHIIIDGDDPLAWNCSPPRCLSIYWRSFSLALVFIRTSQWHYPHILPLQTKLPKPNTLCYSDSAILDIFSVVAFTQLLLLSPTTFLLVKVYHIWTSGWGPTFFMEMNWSYLCSHLRGLATLVRYSSECTPLLQARSNI